MLYLIFKLWYSILRQKRNFLSISTQQGINHAPRSAAPRSPRRTRRAAPRDIFQLHKNNVYEFFFNFFFFFLNIRLVLNIYVQFCIIFMIEMYIRWLWKKLSHILSTRIAKNELFLGTLSSIKWKPKVAQKSSSAFWKVEDVGLLNL